jgi:hypothetical protein
MFIEGYIDQNLLTLLKASGADIVWKTSGPQDLKTYGYINHGESAEEQWQAMQEEGLIIVRVFYDCDFEDLISPKTLISFMKEKIKKKYLPLLIHSKNKAIREAVEQELCDCSHD